MKRDFKVSTPLAVLAILIFFLIVVGGMVRNLGAGLSCPDWPLCQGRIIPEFDPRVFAEYFHRLFAATVSLLTLVLSVLIFSNTKLRAQLGKPMGWALAFLFSQVILGGLTVLKLLQSEIVTLHLATGTMFFLIVLYMALKSRNPQIEATQDPEKLKLSNFGKHTLIAVYFQIILGGVVSSHYAGLACPDFPKCLGEWWPAMTGNVPYQVLHRIGATVIFIITLIFVFKLLKSRLFPVKTTLIILALFTQIALGISNVIFRLPVPMSVAHLAVAQALIALVLMTTYEIRYFCLR
jgi:heme a synthase